MSDEDLDRDWKPNGRRPQSTMARSFSAALDDMFKIDNSIADLDAAVAEKKQAVSSQTSELEALEARLRATEERLKASGLAISPQSPRQRIPLGDAFNQDKETSPTTTRQQTKAPSRPNTASRPGALPPTPGASEGECVEA